MESLNETLPLDKDALYRMRHPERVKESYKRHYDANRDAINAKRRERRKRFREAVANFDEQDATKSI